MLQLTKIFQFETAHAIFGYQGGCKNIHGHSYELHVTVASPHDDFIPAPGFILDFKKLKAIVSAAVGAGLFRLESVLNLLRSTHADN